MTLKSLVEEIRKESKMTADEISAELATAFDEDEDADCIFKHLYTKVYGEHLNKTLAENWVKSMDVTDGSGRETGEMWTLEQTTDVGQKLNVDWNTINKFEWYAVMNAWYSDFYRTAKIYNHEKDPAFYANLVIDFFIKDTDAKDKSVFNYYFHHVN